jgi:Holliday junction resolvasome RuvABC endonuclease subunit
MRCVGFDIAAVSYSGFAMVENDDLIVVESHKPDPKWDEPFMLNQFYKWCKNLLFIYRPDIVAVEKKMGYKNQLQAAMMIGRREGIALLAGAQNPRCIVINPGATTSRSIVFGNGKLSKDQAWAKRGEIWPGFDFGKKTVGGTDKMDAATHALAAPKAIQRKK